MNDDLMWLPPVAALIVIGVVLLRQFIKRRRYQQWLYIMRKTMRLPDMKDCGDGWVRCTCTNCYHKFLWWREDECVCTKCGVDYHHSQHLSDDGYQPMA